MAQCDCEQREPRYDENNEDAPGLLIDLPFSVASMLTTIFLQLAGPLLRVNRALYGCKRALGQDLHGPEV